MNPYPHIAQDERHGDEEQSQARIARAGIDSSLPMLAIAGFDAESFAIPLADCRGRSMHEPGREEQFLVSCFAVFAVSMTTVAHADRERHLLFAASHGIRIPASWLTSECAKAGRFAATFGASARELYGHQKRQLFLLQQRHHGNAEKASIEQQTPYFQANFADSGHHATQHASHRLVASHPSQGQRYSDARARQCRPKRRRETCLCPVSAGRNRFRCGCDMAHRSTDSSGKSIATSHARRRIRRGMPSVKASFRRPFEDSQAFWAARRPRRSGRA